MVVVPARYWKLCFCAWCWLGVHLWEELVCFLGFLVLISFYLVMWGRTLRVVRIAEPFPITTTLLFVLLLAGLWAFLFLLAHLGTSLFYSRVCLGLLSRCCSRSQVVSFFSWSFFRAFMLLGSSCLTYIYLNFFYTNIINLTI